jgi:hypothetical protein
MKSQAYVKGKKTNFINHTWRAFRRWPDVEIFGFMFGGHLCVSKEIKHWAVGSPQFRGCLICAMLQ